MKALTKALAILKTIAQSNEPLGVSEIAETLEFNRSMVSKVLSTFRDAEIIQQDPTTKKYHPGIGSFVLGMGYINRLDIAEIGTPILRRVVDQTSHSAVISILHENEVFHLVAMEGRLFLDARWRVGQTLPFHASSAGRVLLAFEEQTQIDAIIAAKGMQRLTPKTISDPSTFKRALQLVRRTGIAVTKGESLPGLGAIAVPVFGAKQNVVASLALIFPDHLVSEKDEAVLAARLHEVAREFSSRLGASIYPFGGAGNLLPMKTPAGKRSTRGVAVSAKRRPPTGVRK
jgi:DNA-binding IclR family transcriptional regulator